MTVHSGVFDPDLGASVRGSSPSYQGFRILHFGFSVLPVVVGVDKFIGFFADWTRYLSPTFAAAIPMTPHALMYVIGFIEIAAGLLVAAVPRVGAYVVAAWLATIILNLLLLGHYWDVALRDFGLMLGAIALGRMSSSWRTSG